MRRARVAVGLFFVFLTPPLYTQIHFAATQQRPEDDQLFQLVTQISKLQAQKQERQAIPLAERALSMAEKTVPPNDPRYIAVLITAGEVYWRAGAIQTAEPLLQRAAKSAETSLPPSHPLVYASLVNLGLFYREQEDGAKSHYFFKKVVALMEKLHGPEHREVAIHVKLLAESYYQKGDYVHARPLYERAAALFEKLGETNTQAYFATLNDLAESCEMTGDYIRAATLLSRVLDLKRKVYGPNHVSIATTLQNMGAVARKTNNFEQAKTFYVAALVMFEKAFGRTSLEVADVLNQIGLLYSDTDDFERAVPALQAALLIREQKLGKYNRYTAETLLNLAWIQYARGNYAEAEPAYLLALQINERELGPNHPSVKTLLTHLATLYEAKGDIARAIAAQKRSGEIAEYNLDLTLPQGTEEQKIFYMLTLRGETYGTISLHLRAAPNNSEAARLALTTILQRKGRILDVMSDSLGRLRGRLDPQDAVLLDQLTTARSKLAAVMLDTRKTAPPEQSQSTVAQLEAEIARLETQISARSSDFRVLSKPITVEQVQKSIPPGAVLLEFVLYQPFKVRLNKPWDPPRYAVYVLQRDGTLNWSDLGEAAPIDSDVETFRAALRDPARGDVKAIGRALDEKIMRPVRTLIGPTKQLFIAPDDILNLIPFAALVDERNKYLIENYSISYMTSGRDLLRLESSSRAFTVPTILANPSYDLKNKVSLESGNRRSLDFTALTYPPLPGTMEEAAAIKTQLHEAQLLVQEQATEAAVKRLQSPRILHIATHGFFLADQSEDAGPGDFRQLVKATDTNARPLENPLLRSGLVLAGVKQRSSGGTEDGVLTALETAGLNLSGTQLVILSACETGLGDVANGEGVYGLRRSLVLAGSQTQVISLWKVSDRATRDLMTNYYRRLKNSEGRAEAFRQVQLEMLHGASYTHPYFWASFILSGMWTNLEGR